MFLLHLCFVITRDKCFRLRYINNHEYIGRVLGALDLFNVTEVCPYSVHVFIGLACYNEIEEVRVVIIAFTFDHTYFRGNGYYFHFNAFFHYVGVNTVIN